MQDSTFYTLCVLGVCGAAVLGANSPPPQPHTTVGNPAVQTTTRHVQTMCEARTSQYNIARTDLSLALAANFPAAKVSQYAETAAQEDALKRIACHEQPD